MMGDIYCASVAGETPPGDWFCPILNFWNVRPTDGWTRRLFLLGYHLSLKGESFNETSWDGPYLNVGAEIYQGGGDLGTLVEPVPMHPDAPPSQVELYTTDMVNPVSGYLRRKEEFNFKGPGIGRWYQWGSEPEIQNTDSQSNGWGFIIESHSEADIPFGWALNVYWLEQ